MLETKELSYRSHNVYTKFFLEYDSVHKLAYSDALTQLDNRVAYLERLEDAVKTADEKMYRNKIQLKKG